MDSTRFRRRSELPGVEVLEVVDSQRQWRCVTSAFELMVPESWKGHVVYRGARHWLEPGMLFCPGPGDTFEISRAEAPGSFRVLMLEREALCAVLAEHQLSPESLAFHRVMRDVPASLHTALRRFLDELQVEASTLSLQASMQQLGLALATRLGTASRRPQVVPNAQAAERVRELIHADVEGTLDLQALSRETGLSRFQVLRVFKRAYGLPPHAYQLCVRIARAKRLLCMGHRPAYVATELRFSDQSHLNRHFKRLLGVTPSEYAQAAAG
jgi:AraC-like DNA-binding protein